ncbi:hypothetical protein FOPG_00175 [Fusarium oxysporum f. sp. conglutinans race 2 54008]|uniref:Uncharacterized protein n=1 Tax=Fusarium oxysporum f. sp. conglutinans race 2 54008 TaxID=1089457 RepID=X0JXB0_FUSOX|nr:hypothetical protein FOPG_00175 [Fusarium oxysporum f. sp. conglutinans race 2 54008]KAG6991577.1 hypothetical protein FocnCong_v018254 [Fusarium oxysporum f. sp. conglutinans]KAG6991580.1 hypothetical protein FocnCong_v018253 [Fusarium oxysporum f. sp. conglutinans]KAG6992261.1 hypothetical protein FocnCong_v018257 [Fusarium oxysporum f. sp. conglutinans]
MAVAPYQDSTIKQFLTEKDPSRRSVLTKLWLESKISELGIVSVTSALLIATFCATFSWYNTSASPWSALACWTSGLVIAVGSLGTAAQQTLSLNHLKSYPGFENEICDYVGHDATNTAGNTVRQPAYSRIYILQIPVMMLKLSFVLFLVGLGLAVWDASIKRGRNSAESKIAVAYTITVIFVGINYAISSIFLYRKTSKVKAA